MFGEFCLISVMYGGDTRITSEFFKALADADIKLYSLSGIFGEENRLCLIAETNDIPQILSLIIKLNKKTASRTKIMLCGNLRKHKNEPASIPKDEYILSAFDSEITTVLF